MQHELWSEPGASQGRHALFTRNHGHFDLFQYAHLVFADFVCENEKNVLHVKCAKFYLMHFNRITVFQAVHRWTGENLLFIINNLDKEKISASEPVLSVIISYSRAHVMAEFMVVLWRINKNVFEQQAIGLITVYLVHERHSYEFASFANEFRLTSHAVDVMCVQ